VRSTRCAPLLTGTLLVFVLSIGSSGRAAGQTPGQVPVPSPGFPSQTPSPDQEAQDRIQKEMAKKANQERQAQLKRDTEHLFKLATELKQYVDQTNENTLSVEVIKKAEEIEKLAHSVKEKMKGQ
jgi:methionyl-tRNA synthetase